MRGRTFDNIEFDVPKTSPPWNLRPWTWGLEDYVVRKRAWRIPPLTGLARAVVVGAVLFAAAHVRHAAVDLGGALRLLAPVLQPRHWLPTA